MDQFGAPKVVVETFEQIDPLVLEGIAGWMEQRGLKTPVSQVVGFTPTRFKAVSFATGGSLITTGSTSWVDVGASTVTGLPPGVYFLIVTALVHISSAAQKVCVGVSENGTDPALIDNPTVAQTQNTVPVIVTAAYATTLRDARTDLKLRWKVDGGTGSLNWAQLAYAKNGNT